MHGTGGGGDGHHGRAQLDEPPRGRFPDGAESLDRHPAAGELPSRRGGRGVGGLRDPEAGDAQLVVGQATQRPRQADGRAVVPEFVQEDGCVLLGQTHV